MAERSYYLGYDIDFYPDTNQYKVSQWDKNNCFDSYHNATDAIKRHINNLINEKMKEQIDYYDKCGVIINPIDSKQFAKLHRNILESYARYYSKNPDEIYEHEHDLILTIESMAEDEIWGECDDELYMQKYEEALERLF